MRTRTVMLATAAGIAVIVAIGVTLVLTRSTGGDDAARLAPADTLAYVTLDVSGAQPEALERLLGRFPEVDVSDGIVRAVGDLLDDPLGEIGLSFEADVEPWLGDELAAFVAPPADAAAEPDWAVVLATDDPDAGRQAAQAVFEADDNEGVDRTHRGTAYVASQDGTAAYGVVEGFLVAGNEPGVHAAVDASLDDGLAASERFTTAVDRLPSRRLASFYIDLPAIIDTMETLAAVPPGQSQDLSFYGLTEDAVAAGAVVVGTDRITIESVASAPQTPVEGTAPGSPQLAESVPVDSWLAIGFPQVGTTLEGVLDGVDDTSLPGGSEEVEQGFRDEFGLDLRDDVLSWMGDARLFLRGASPLAADGALIVDSSDADATGRFVDRVTQLAEQENLPVRPVERQGLRGGSVRQPGVPAPVFLLGGDRLVLAFGEDAVDDAIAPSEPLEGNARFRDAQGSMSGYDTVMFVDLTAAREFAEVGAGLLGIPLGSYDAEVRPWIEPLGYLASGARTDGDLVFQRFVIGLADADE